MGTSAHEKATYQPSASLEIGDGLGHPLQRRDQWTLIRPILDRTRKPLSSVAPLPNSLKVNEWIAVAPLETRKARLLAPLDATEERLIRLIQPRQHVLQDVAVNGRILGELRANVLEFRFLLIA